ncbi:hypothetical protein PMZ80_008564 [Knufia obscura]|uniref:Cryptococcal mannosyltransferase 1-domain-containing protein n=1 Tax=Knufia obscura TaxID=1635080 RepID=A0ABR0RF55_9EURO|nr:hypothetical protein PMZ80_008564 [Knufia obscura]
MNGVFRPSCQNPPQHYKELTTRAHSSSRPGRGNIAKEKVFIAANIIDEGLIRGQWGTSLLSLIDLLGEDNTFVSIYDNDSGEATSAALRELQLSMKCNSSVVTGDHLPLSSFPTTRLPNGEERVRRITYLAEIRNRLLRPLDSQYVTNSTEGFVSAAKTKLDKTLFLNDVYFDPVEAAQLLFSTNYHDGKARYRAACGIDFVHGVQMYDTFFVRDAEGYGSGLMVYPWFAPVGHGVSRKAVLGQTDAVPVRSCWGGMAAFDAALFQTRDASSPFTNTPDYSLLQFRSSEEPFWEASECCLIFADIEERCGLPDIAHGTGVFLNPYIRVAYSKTTWQWLPFFRRFERIFQYAQYIVSKVAYPRHGERRLHEAGDMVNQLVWQPSSHNTSQNAGRFIDVHRQATSGGFCGLQKMFVMEKDLQAANTGGTGRNWESVNVPADEN